MESVIEDPNGPSPQPVGAAEVRCARLRTKGMYLPLNPMADGATAEGSATAVFWCLRTMKMLGPDSGPVTPSDCSRPERDCYRAPE